MIWSMFSNSCFNISHLLIVLQSDAAKWRPRCKKSTTPNNKTLWTLSIWCQQFYWERNRKPLYSVLSVVTQSVMWEPSLPMHGLKGNHINLWPWIPSHHYPVVTRILSVVWILKHTLNPECANTNEIRLHSAVLRMKYRNDITFECWSHSIHIYFNMIL